MLGRHLCAALLAEGHELAALSRRPESVKARCGADTRALASLDEWRDDDAFDAVINLAGEPIIDERWSERRKRSLWESRVVLTQDLARRIERARHKPAVLLSGSATGYYGDAGDRELDESSPRGSDFSARLCVAWEDAARKAADCGVRVCLLRTGLVLARDGGLLARVLPPFKFGAGARIGSGRQWMSWIHIDDYVAIVLLLLKTAGASGPCNMTAPRPVTNREFTSVLAGVLRRPALFAAPGWFLKLVLGERAELLLGGQRALPAKAGSLGYEFVYRELRPALQALLGR